jgi:putative hydrolase of the HAD superfamily
MVRQHFSHVRHWVFDLDNTLYPPEARLFDHIQAKMNAWVMRELGVDAAEADRLRAHYWREHGTTLAGLMTHHRADPWTYLREVHDIPMDTLTPDPALAEAIAALPGRRIVYTNGDAEYAGRVLKARGLTDVFDAVYGVEHANWLPKPEAAAFELVFAAAALEPKTAAMFEDDIRNLAVPHGLGMRTVHVAPLADPQPHVHHHTPDLPGFLAMLR